MKLPKNFRFFELGGPDPDGEHGETTCIFCATNFLEVVKEYIELGEPKDHFIDEWRMLGKGKDALPFPVREIDLATGIWSYAYPGELKKDMKRRERERVRLLTYFKKLRKEGKLYNNRID